jgi:hypothetical protein
LNQFISKYFKYAVLSVFFYIQKKKRGSPGPASSNLRRLVTPVQSFVGIGTEGIKGIHTLIDFRRPTPTENPYPQPRTVPGLGLRTN